MAENENSGFVRRDFLRAAAGVAGSLLLPSKIYAADKVTARVTPQTERRVAPVRTPEPGTYVVGPNVVIEKSGYANPSLERIILDRDRNGRDMKPITEYVVFDAYAKPDELGRGNVLHIEYSGVMPRYNVEREAFNRTVLSTHGHDLMIAHPADMVLHMDRKMERTNLCKINEGTIVKEIKDIDETSFQALMEVKLMQKSYEYGMKSLPLDLKDKLENFISMGSERNQAMRVKKLEEQVPFSYKIVLVPYTTEETAWGNTKYGHQFDIPFSIFGNDLGDRKVFVALLVRMENSLGYGKANFARTVMLKNFPLVKANSNVPTEIPKVVATPKPNYTPAPTPRATPVVTQAEIDKGNQNRGTKQDQIEGYRNLMDNAGRKAEDLGNSLGNFFERFRR